MSRSEPLNIPLMLLIALLQGLALLLLYQAGEHQVWPDGQPQWQIALYTLFIAGPVLLLLALNRLNQGMIGLLTGVFVVIITLFGFYLGLQGRPVGESGLGTPVAVFALTVGIACFKVLMYMQQLSSDEKMSYGRLYHYSWRNFLTLGLSLLFMLVFWGILLLWGSLFEIIEIDFFSRLFEQEWFLFPALAVAHGLGVIIFRKMSGIIDTVRRLQQALMLSLLPVLVLIAVLFLAFLPFAGTETLWATGRGSLMILWLQALVLFFVNGVYQDEFEERPYPLLVHRLIYFGILLLPACSVISFHGLSLRIAQYGWTLDRCWAFMVWAVLALFSLGYLWGIVRRGDQWIRTLGTVNISMGLVVLLLMMLANSPWLDFRKLVVANQVARLDTAAVDPADFDYYYLYRNLAGPGYAALEALGKRYAGSHPDIVVNRIAVILAGKGEMNTISAEAFAAQVEQWPDNRALPLALETQLREAVGRQTRDVARNLQYYLFRLDLDGDGVDEYVFLRAAAGYGFAKLYYLAGDAWVSVDMPGSGQWDPEQIKRDIGNGDIGAVVPRWQDFRIGDRVFSPAD